ncbi:MAG: ABC transporter permease, partial [Deltaproteobacteria bacterium]|nr:ABC transporter permease [Deltaproteobacteria bacterium]
MLRLDDLLRVSVRQVLRQRWRNLGVVLAIALGTAGFAVIITMGQDVKENLNKDLELLGGATRIKAHFEKDLKKYAVSRHEPFQPSTVAALRRLPGVSAAAQAAFRGKLTLYTRQDRGFAISLLAGADQFFWEVNGISALSGSLFGPEEVKGRERVCVLGSNVAKRIFGHYDVAGQLLLIDNNYYRVMGVLQGLGASDRTKWVIVPITTAYDRVEGLGPADVVYLRCHTWDDVERVAAAVPMVVRAHQSGDGLSVRVEREALKRLVRMAWGVQLFVYLAISATLILGGFGIWNIMMSGVQSRTR